LPLAVVHLVPGCGWGESVAGFGRSVNWRGSPSGLCRCREPDS